MMYDKQDSTHRRSEHTKTRVSLTSYFLVVNRFFPVTGLPPATLANPCLMGMRLQAAACPSYGGKLTVFWQNIFKVFDTTWQSSLAIHYCNLLADLSCATNIGSRTNCTITFSHQIAVNLITRSVKKSCDCGYACFTNRRSGQT